MKLGCHAAMFGRDRMAGEPDVLLKEIATTGFAGFECNARFVVGEPEKRFDALLKENGLELSALHYSADWVGNTKEAIAGAVRIAEFLATQPSKNIEMSGNWDDMTEETMVEAAKNINIAAREVAKFGVALNYHNHNGEFIKGARPYRIMREFAPDMYFGFDIGWIYKGGFNPISVLKENRGRVRYVHLRDPQKLTVSPEELHSVMPRPGAKVQEPSPEILKFFVFPDLGEGDADIKAQINFLNGYLPDDGWVVVEYETGAPDVNRYIKAKKLIDELLLV